MKSFSNSDKIKSFIAPNMIDIIIFLDNNIILSVYTRGNINEIYCYLETIEAPTKLTASGQRSCHFFPSYSTNNDTATFQPVIEAIRMIKKSSCGLCGSIGHKADAYIICGPKCLPSSIRRNMDQFNALHADEPTYLPREWNSQPPAYHFKSRTSPLKTSPVVSSKMGRFNYHAIGNCDVYFHPS